MSYTYTGYFGAAGGGKSGATVDAWLVSRFSSAPQEGTNPPSGTPDAGPVTTAITYGGPGAYTLTLPSVSDYYVRIQYGGVQYWTSLAAGKIVGGSGGSTPTVVGSTKFTATITDSVWGGADGNGDWTGAFARATAAVVANGSGAIWVPPGTYQVGITSPSTPGVLVPSACKLMGAGRDVSTIQAGSSMTANVVQSSQYGLMGGDLTPQIDGLTIAGNKLNAAPWAYATTVFDGASVTSITVTMAPLFQNYAPWTSTTFAGTFGTYNGVAVSPSAPGHAWVSDQLISYTGVTSSSTYTGTLTGCQTQQQSGTYNFSLVPTATFLHARVYPFNQGGHAIAFQGKECSVGRAVRINSTGPGGHGIWLQGTPAGVPGTSTVIVSPAGHDIEPTRIDQYGGYAVAFGPQVTDARCGGFSSNLSTDGYGGVLVVGNGDFDIHNIHCPTLTGIDSPTVTICCSDVNVTNLTTDTTTCDVARLDSSGHWAVPNQIRNFVLDKNKWESPGFPVPGAGNLALGYGVPIIQSNAASSGGLGHVVGGMLTNVATAFGYAEAFQEGPLALLLGFFNTVTLPQSVLNVHQINGFDNFGGSSFPLAIGTDSVTYTGIVRAGAQINASSLSSGLLPVSGATGSFTAGSPRGNVPNSTSFPWGGSFPTSGIAIIWHKTFGPLEFQYTNAVTSGSGMNATVTFTYTSATATTINSELSGNPIPNGTIITIAQFTGCTGGSGTWTELTQVTQPALQNGETIGFDLSGIIQSPTITPTNLVGPVVNANSTFVLPASSSASSWMFKDYNNTTGGGTAKNTEWSVITTASTATHIIKLPNNPQAGQQNRVEVEGTGSVGWVVGTVQNTAGYTPNPSAYNTITLSGTVTTPTSSTGVTLSTTAGTVYEFTWDSVNVTWRGVIL